MKLPLFEKAPAKINLSLDVLSRRDDGMHNVEMVMTTIDLADRVELIPLRKNTIKISLESRYVPSDERNLAYKAAETFKRHFNINEGVHIKIEKSIPVSAGLGGGSSDAAAVLRGLNKLWGLNIPMSELAKIGSTLGADVSFCVYGKTAIAKGYGEIIEPLPSPPACFVVLAKPNIGVSTRTIFEKIDLNNIYHPNTEKVLQALKEGDFNMLCNNIGNSLERITESIYPEVKHIRQTMKSLGASGVMMSGSGPTVYGLVEHESKAKRIYNGMRGFCNEVHLVRLIG